MSAFSLLIPPVTLTGYLHRLTERSATTHMFTYESASSVHDLSPVTLSAQENLIRLVSYYAFFK